METKANLTCYVRCSLRCLIQNMTTAQWKKMRTDPLLKTAATTTKTRTHSMARHRKSPRSRKNLMVIDPLTPSQGHQFDHRLKMFSLSWSIAHPLKFDAPHANDYVQKIKFLTPPQGPRGWRPKKLCTCICHSCR